jgi:hypothetical protein
MSTTRPPPLLESLTIASPCAASWADMTGDERVRHCGLCDQAVYNLSDMTRAEAEALVRGRTGRLCARLYRRSDGTVMTRDCPVGRLRTVRRRVAAAVGAVGVLLVTLVGWVVGTPGRAREVADRARAVEPFRTVMDWIDPPPRPEALMGEVLLSPEEIEQFKEECAAQGAEPAGDGLRDQADNPGSR